MPPVELEGQSAHADTHVNVERSHGPRLTGRIEGWSSDGGPGLRVTAVVYSWRGATRTRTELSVLAGSDGRFEFISLPPGECLVGADRKSVV